MNWSLKQIFAAMGSLVAVKPNGKNNILKFSIFVTVKYLVHKAMSKFTGISALLMLTLQKAQVKLSL